MPKKADPRNWVERKLNCKFVGSTATKYGQTSEPLARKYFEETTGQTVETAGLIVHQNVNWLDASNDWIIDTDTILQNKWLQVHDGSLLKMIKSNKYDVKHASANQQ